MMNLLYKNGKSMKKFQFPGDFTFFNKFNKNISKIFVGFKAISNIAYSALVPRHQIAEQNKLIGKHGINYKDKKKSKIIKNNTF